MLRFPALVVLLVPAGCAASFSVPEPVSPEPEEAADVLTATLKGGKRFAVGDAIVFDFALHNPSPRSVRYDGIRDVSHRIPAGSYGSTSTNVDVVVTQFSGRTPTGGYDGTGCGMKPPLKVKVLRAGASEVCRIQFRATKDYDGGDGCLVPGEYEISAAYTDGDGEDEKFHRIPAKPLRFIVTD